MTMAAKYIIAKDPYELIFDAMKSKVPIFDGSNAEGWFSQINRLFDLHNTPEDWRLRLVSYHMEGEADDWLLWSLANNQLSSWPDFQFRFQQYFGCPVFEGNCARSKPVQVTLSSDYDLVFKSLIDETTTLIENLESKRKKIPLEEAVSIGEQDNSCDVEPNIGNGRELPGNTEMTTLHSSSPNTCFVRPEYSKVNVKFEVKKASSISLVHVPAYPLYQSSTWDRLQEKNAAKVAVISPELKVFDKMSDSIFCSAKEVVVCLKGSNQDFLAEKEMKNDTPQSDLIFDPGGSGGNSNDWKMNISLSSVVQFLLGTEVKDCCDAKFSNGATVGKPQESDFVFDPGVAFHFEFDFMNFFKMMA